MNTRLSSVVAFVVLGLTFSMRNAHGETIPTVGAVDPRVRVVAYNPDDVVKLQGYVGYQIHMRWAEGEEFVNLGSGDNAAFDVGADRNHFFIKPKQERVGTNLTVLTNRRAYHFEYAVGKPPPTGKAMKRMVYSIRFIYPQDEARLAAAELERLKTEARFARQGTGERSRNMDYWFCGSKTLQPISAYDDGVHTRLRFQARSEFPAIFVKNDDNSESLLNFNVEDDEVVIHRVASRLMLRRGQLVGCVMNRAFAGGAERLKSSTTAPDVVRATTGVNP